MCQSTLTTLFLALVLAWPLDAQSAGPGGCDGVANRSPLSDESDRPRNSVNLSPAQRDADCRRRAGQTSGRDATRAASGETVVQPTPIPPSTIRSERVRDDRERVRDRGTDGQDRIRHRDSGRDRVRDRESDRDRDRSRDRGDRNDTVAAEPDRPRTAGTPAGQVSPPAAVIGQPGGVGSVPLSPAPVRPSRPSAPPRQGG